MGKPGMNASIATKCNDQTPLPKISAAPPNQKNFRRPSTNWARDIRLTVVAQAMTQIKAARMTSRPSYPGPKHPEIENIAVPLPPRAAARLV